MQGRIARQEEVVMGAIEHAHDHAGVDARVDDVATGGADYLAAGQGKLRGMPTHPAEAVQAIPVCKLATGSCRKGKPARLGHPQVAQLLP